MTILEEYLNQLKELGVYDTSAVIITADHGDVHESPVFFVKVPEERHEKITVNNAPVSHREFLPTLAEYAGLNYTQYGSGKSIHDFSPGQERERVYWTRDFRDSYRKVPNFSGEKDGSTNVYYGYQYTGSMNDINWDKPEYIIQMVDSFF